MTEAASALHSLGLFISACNRCGLCATRRNAVPGEGSATAKIMMVGEAPGSSEDASGRPFVGAAGKLLDELLLVAAIARDSVFIANVIKCRPPDNRDPSTHELAMCRGWLEAQIMVVKPMLLVALGKYAAEWVLQRPVAITKERGTLQRVNIAGHQCVLMPVLHPAAALRREDWRMLLEEDFRRIPNTLQNRGYNPEAKPTLHIIE